MSEKKCDGLNEMTLFYAHIEKTKGKRSIWMSYLQEGADTRMQRQEQNDSEENVETNYCPGWRSR